jgi:hypothetical protein
MIVETYGFPLSRLLWLGKERTDKIEEWLQTKPNEFE